MHTLLYLRVAQCRNSFATRIKYITDNTRNIIVYIYIDIADR